MENGLNKFMGERQLVEISEKFIEYITRNFLIKVLKLVFPLIHLHKDVTKEEEE